MKTANDLLIPLPTPEQHKRFFKKIKVRDFHQCWEWTGATTRGRGLLTRARVNYYAHRVAYSTWVGPIPEGMEVDHLCFNGLCCNPFHLDVVTPVINKHRAAIHKGYMKDTCLNGHWGLWAIKNSGKRYCIQCSEDYHANRK